MARGRLRRGRLLLTIKGDHLTLRNSLDGTGPFALTAFAGTLLACVGAAGLPGGWAAPLGFAGLALVGAGVVGAAIGQVPYVLDRRDGSARRGPRRLGRVVGVYVQAAISPDGDRFTLYLRREDRPAVAVGSARHRDAVQDLAIRIASFLDVEWHQGPGDPK
jgi:hypothetical protein